MRNYLFIALILSSFTVQAAKIAKVDIQKVLLTVEDGKKVRDKLKKNFESKQKIISKEEEKIRKMQEDFQKQSLVMNDKAKMKKGKEIQDKFMALQQQMKKYQDEIKDQENTLKKPILEKVRSVVESISKSGNYDMVFEISTSPIYVKEVTDITDQVVQAYNKKK